MEYSLINKKSFLLAAPSRFNQRGFTLLELLIIVAILGILAIVVVANMGTFLHISRVNAANSELEHVLTANRAYKNTNGSFAESSVILVDGGYFDRDLKGTYVFNPETGEIDDELEPPDSGYEGVIWNPEKRLFE